MKKTILTIAIALGASGAFAQTSLASKINQATQTATTASTYASQASAVASKLNSVLALTGTQKPQVATIVTDYLKSKANISSLATTNASDYTSKLSDLNSGMFSKLKTALTAVQYAKLLGLKTSKTTDVLSALFI
ncbi:hypothetical protein [Pedobacter sp. ASV28]|uniref:hypothetical protein n=1 Tax=Pedobacter sp. ASV28 TaxID=2795123 RepID=UPI0018EA758E|nr:hypothetical protein [Pedobacter sp. ASV28]